MATKLESTPRHQPERFKDFNEFYQEVDHQLRPLLTQYFPAAAAEFSPPTMAKVRNDFENHLELAQPWINEAAQPALAGELRIALKTVALVRYLDDFIDDHVWPHLNLQDPIEQQRFSGLLNEFLKLAQQLEPSFTDKSLNIFRVEASLAAEPTQANFDKNFRELFLAKSYDIVLCYCQTNHLDINSMHTELVMMGMVDCFRDFQPAIAGKPETSTDFDLYHFIETHHLNPTKLISFVETALRHLSPEVFQEYQQGQTADEMQTKQRYGSGILLIVRTLELLKLMYLKIDYSVGKRKLARGTV